MLRILPSYVVAVIEDNFPWARTTTPPSFVEPVDVPKIASILALVARIPEVILRCSGADYLSLVQIVPALEHVVNFYASGPPRQIVWPFVAGNNAITTLWLVLKGCPDDAASEVTPDLRFIENQVLRDSIRLDLSASESALNNGEWKAATVLAGAVVEALLLWAVDRHTENDAALQDARQRGANVRKVNAATPDEWHLPELIEAGFELGEITPQSAAQARVAGFQESHSSRQDYARERQMRPWHCARSLRRSSVSQSRPRSTGRRAITALTLLSSAAHIARS